MYDSRPRGEPGASSVGGLDGAQTLLLLQYLGKKLGGTRSVKSDSLHLFRMTSTLAEEEEDSAIPSIAAVAKEAETQHHLVQFQSRELQRVRRLEAQRNRSGAHLERICTAFLAAHAQLAEAQAGAREAYGALRARLVQNLGHKEASRLPAVRQYMRDADDAGRAVSLGLLLDDKLGEEPAALDPALLQRLEQLQWKQILIRDEHQRVHCIPPPPAYASIKRALHKATLRTAEAMEAHRRTRRTERLPDGTVRCTEEEVRTRAVRLQEAHHEIGKRIQHRVRALETGCAAQELRVEWVQYLTEIARHLVSSLEAERAAVRAILGDN